MPGGSALSNHEALQREVGERLRRWLTEVDQAPPASFTAIDDLAGMPAQARAESHYWCDEVLAPDANPYDTPGARHGHRRATRGAPDLLRHAYTAKGLGITVVEGRNFLLVQVDPRSVDVLALAAPARRAAIHEVAEALLRAPRGGALRFQVPDEIGEGVCFCNDDTADPLLLAGWSERVEGGVHGGRLYFLCYKKAAQRVGFAGEERWFDGAVPKRRRPSRSEAGKGRDRR
jgi:hypothetical protein